MKKKKKGTKKSLGFSQKKFSCDQRPETYLEPSRASTMELFAKIVNRRKPLAIFTKNLHHR